jgi:phosphoglycolate phosphatase
VKEVTEELNSDGYSLCVCTNKPRDLADKVLEETGLASSFEFVVGGGDLPSSKPDPAYIDTCLKHFNIQLDQALLIGDSLVDQQLSVNANIAFVMYAGGYNSGVIRSNVAGEFYDYFHLPFLIRSL